MNELLIRERKRKCNMKDFGLMVLGTFSFAFSVAIFSMPNSLAEGGIAGLSLLLYFGLDWSPALVTFIANGLILLIGYRYLPKVMIIKSIAAIPLFSILLFIMEDFGSAMDDPLLVSLYSGVFTVLGFFFFFCSVCMFSGISTISLFLNFKFVCGLMKSNFVLIILV